MARKPMIEQVKMLCTSNKEEIIEINFSITNFLKMLITCARFAALYGNGQLLQHLFCFCLSEK